MIVESDYRLPHAEQPKPKPNAAPETLDYLESLPWRPFTEEW